MSPGEKVDLQTHLSSQSTTFGTTTSEPTSTTTTHHITHHHHYSPRTHHHHRYSPPNPPPPPSNFCFNFINYDKDINVTLHIDGQSTNVDVPPDIIIDVVDEDDDITDDEDALRHDLAKSDNEDRINVDDDDVAWSHGGDGGDEDRPPPHHVPNGCMGCFANRGKGKRKPNLGGRAFELRDKQTVMPLGDHAAHWSSYIGEVIRGVPLYYPSWLKVPKERKAAIITDIRHLQKAYNTNKATFKAQHWVIDPTTRTYNVEKIRWKRRENITASEWDKYIEFWNDPRNIARAAQNRQNWAKSTVISRQGSRSLSRLRDEMMQTSTTQEYPSLIDTLFMAHTVNGEFLWDEDQCIYETRRLEAMGTYTDDEINRLARGWKKQGLITGMGMYCRHGPQPAQFKSGGASGSGRCGDEEEGADHQDDEDEDGDGDT
nr:hypothetical protein [Tanacetum cinerariifolium]